MSSYPDNNSINKGKSEEAEDLLTYMGDSSETLKMLNSFMASEEKYRTIFESIDEGYLLCRVIFDEEGKPADIVFLETNSAFENVTGVKIVTGNTLLRTLPGIEAFWISIPALVVRLGKAVRHVGYVGELKRWLDVHICRIGKESDHTVAVLVNNITERKQQEANVRFLAEITAEFSKLSSAIEIMKTVGEKVGKYFGVSRCHFSSIDDEAGVSVVINDWHLNSLSSIVTGNRLLLRDFINDNLLDLLRKGEAIVVDNVNTASMIEAKTYLAYGVQSFISTPLIKDGKLRFLINLSDVNLRKWSEDEILLLRELASRIWLHLERLYAEEALRESEHRYRTLFETMDEGFAVCRLIRDKDGKGINYRFLQLNPACEVLTGLKPEEITGRLATDVVPGLDHWWIETFQSVLDTGVSKRFEHYVPQLGRWLDINAFPYGGDNFAVLYDDITRRKQYEDELLRRKEKKAFIIRLSDLIRSLNDPAEIQGAIVHLLGKHLSANRVIYSQYSSDEIKVQANYTNGVASIEGVYPVTFLSEEAVSIWKSGTAYYTNDINSDTRFSEIQRERMAGFNIASFISFGIMRNNVPVASLGVHSSVPRDWTAEDLALVCETAERAWAAVERANSETALRDSKERYLQELESEVHQRTSELIASKEQYSSLVENTPDIITRWNKELKLLYANTAFQNLSGINIKNSIGKKIQEIVKSVEESKSYIDSLKKAFIDGVPVVYYNNYESLEGEKYFYSRIVPEKNSRGEVVTVLSIARDITEFKRAELELLELKLRQQREILNTVLATQEQVRERIGESLHNGVAQLLYGIQTRMELLNPGSAGDKKNISDILGITRDAIRDIRKLSFELIPVVLKDFGIEVALKSLFGRIIQGKPEIDLVMNGFTKRLPEQIELAVYRIVQELVNNILKHSKATKAKIELTLRKGKISMLVIDNGVGVTLKNDKLQNGIGLQSVRNRVQLLGGTMVFHPVKTGTSVEIMFDI